MHVHQCMNERCSWVIAYIRVVPIEEQPVDSLQLVFPERIAVFIFSGILGFLPVAGGRSLLFKIKQFPLVVSVQPQERGPLSSLAQHSKEKIKRGLEKCQLLPHASAPAHAPSLSRIPQSFLGQCQHLTPTCCPHRARSTTSPGTELQAAGTHVKTMLSKTVLTFFYIFWGRSDWHLHSCKISTKSFKSKVIHVVRDRCFENDWSGWMREKSYLSIFIGAFRHIQNPVHLHIIWVEGLIVHLSIRVWLIG